MPDIELKIVLLGDSNTGKTAIVTRFLVNDFGSAKVPTIGAAFSSTTQTVDGEDIGVSLWDTSGEEKYESISKIYYRGAKAALLCYDLTNYKSFERAAKFWTDALRAHTDGCKLFLVGTKADLLSTNPRAVPIADVEKFAKKEKAGVVETSSLTGSNVRELFQMVFRDYVQNRGAKPKHRSALSPPPGGPATPTRTIDQTPTTLTQAGRIWDGKLDLHKPQAPPTATGCSC